VTTMVTTNNKLGVHFHFLIYAYEGYHQAISFQMFVFGTMYYGLNLSSNFVSNKTKICNIFLIFMSLYKKVGNYLFSPKDM